MQEIQLDHHYPLEYINKRDNIVHATWNNASLNSLLDGFDASISSNGILQLCKYDYG